MIDPSRIEKSCWDTVQEWCQEGAVQAVKQRDESLKREVTFTVEFHADETGEYDLSEPVPTYCAFEGGKVLAGFNSDDRLQALVLAANWCRKNLVSAY